MSCCFLTALTAFPPFLHSLVPERAVITESCSRASTVARFTLQNGLGQNWLLLCQESHDWFSFSWDPLPYLLTQPLTELLNKSKYICDSSCLALSEFCKNIFPNSLLKTYIFSLKSKQKVAMFYTNVH